MTYSTSASSAQALAGQAIAVRVTGDPDPTNNGLFYLHNDHLGSVRAMSDENGDLVPDSTARYTPFGDWRTEPGTNPEITDRGYTGHRSNNSGANDLGLIYMNARYYVPGIGRFASADTIVPNPANPQSFNRYSYTYNNPLRYIDPSGHATCQSLDGSCYAKEATPITQKAYEDSLINQLKGQNAKSSSSASNSPNLVTDPQYAVWRKMAACSQCHVTHFNGGHVPTNNEIDESTIDFYRSQDKYKVPFFLGVMNVFAFNASLAIELSNTGSFAIIGEVSQYSSSEIVSAQYMADLGNDVVLRPATGVGRTSDLLVNGIPYDVYTPTTSNPNRIISAIAKKNSQAQGVIVDLSNTSVIPNDLGNALLRVQNAGATNIQDIVIFGGN